jgi:penicillin-binding protein 1A
MWLAWAAVCGAVLTLAGIYLYLNPQIPAAETYRQVQLETPLRVLAEDGALVAEFGERRLIPVTLDEVPALFVKAILDTEDKRFYEHSGIDYISLLNDSVMLLWNREIRSGASTITMQLARNISFSLEQTFIRKFKEMLLALKIERELSKDEILELYVNVVPFGKRAYGAQAASYTYYGKPLKALELAQLAMLAGIPQAPTAGNPINGPERALKRRNLVLGRMLDQESITDEAYARAIDSPISARIHARDLDVEAPYAAEWVRQQLLSRYGREIYTGGFEAVTTLDARLQSAANLAVREGLLGYDRRHGYRGGASLLELPAGGVEADEADIAALLSVLNERPVSPGLEVAVVTGVERQSFTALKRDGDAVTVIWDLMKWAIPFVDVNRTGALPREAADVVAPGEVIRVREVAEGWALAQVPEVQGALVSMDPMSGAVRALVGGYDFATNQYNHVLQAARQPGSGFKPFVYSAALHHGVTPASVFMDAPLVFEDENLEDTYRPKNFGGRYNGPTRLREALYRSINLVSMRVMLSVGAGKVLDYVNRFGFDTTTFPRNTQLAIGGGTMAVTPLDMATAYAVFANGGYRVVPNVLKEVRMLDGDVVYRAKHPVVCDPCFTDVNRTPVTPEDDSSLTIDAVDVPIIAERVLDERNAFIVHSMLQDVIRRGTGVRAKSLGRGDLAGKTGTTNEADTWFNGYHPNLVTTVWMGFSDHRPLGDVETGSRGPLPIWIEYMQTALDGIPEVTRAQPAGVLTMKIDPTTGQPASPDQSDAIFEYFIAEHAPRQEPVIQIQTELEKTEQVRPVDIF